jgi:hypothetical protein
MIARGLGSPATFAIDEQVSFLTIEASNLWAGFSKAFFLSCVFRAKRESGRRVVSTQVFPRTTDAISFAIAEINPALGREPNWADPNILLILLQRAGVSNYAEALAALAVPTTVFRDLPTMRNFFAHRGEVTARKTKRVARSAGLSGDLRPSDIMCSRRPGRPQNLLADWIDDMRNVIDLICD